MLDENTATQNEDNALKYKVNEATLQPPHLNSKTTTTEALDGKKYFYTLGESKKNFKLSRQSNYLFIRKQENVMRCNNCDDLLQLSFTLKISKFSEAYI